MYVLVRSSKKMLSHVSQCLWFIKKEGGGERMKRSQHTSCIEAYARTQPAIVPLSDPVPSRPQFGNEKKKKKRKERRMTEKRTRLQCCRMQRSQENEARQNLHRHRRHLATALDLHAAARLPRQLSASCFCSFHERPKTPRCLHDTMLYSVRHSLTELIRESVLVSSKGTYIYVCVCVYVCIDTIHIRIPT